MGFRDLLFRFMNEYRAAYDHVWNTGVFSNEFGDFVRHNVADAVAEIAVKKNAEYSVKGSVGQTKWTPVPWIAIFDKRITNKASKGEYIVYLLNSEKKELYLTFNQACEEKNNKKIRESLKNKALEISKAIQIPIDVSTGTIDSGNAAYDAGCVCYKKYTLSDLPSDENLINDLNTFIDIYEAFYCAFYKINDTYTDNMWFPALSEYDPGISKEQWLDFMKNSGWFNDNYKHMMAAMYAEGGQASCAQLSEKYGNTSAHYNMTAIHMAEQASEYFRCPLRIDGDGKARYWTVLFVGKDASSKETGSFIWKMRDELYNALNQYNIEQYLQQPNRIGVFDSWEIVSETVAVKTCDKSFFDHNGTGIPKGMLWYFGGDIDGPEKNRYLIFEFETKKYKARLERDLRNTYRIFWNTDLGTVFKSKRKNITQYMVFEKTDNRYSLSFKEGELEVTAKQLMDTIKEYISAAGFSYEDGLLENFYLSLKSKPFVILAGTSGTGKTRLVKLFAEAVGATTANGRYKMVAVRPDWSDSSDLFGHVDLNSNFIPGAIIDFVKQAELDSSHPYFLCLDEMNLARVEYYLSDVLSVIETRDFSGGRIVSDPLVSGTYYGGDSVAAGRYGTVPFPENLYIVGTVNMDETTFPFSKKVLDRANTIEFSYVDLTPPAELPSSAPAVSELSNSFLKTEYLLLSQCADHREKVGEYCAELQKMNEILQQAGAHVGYRVRDEIVFYLLNNETADLLPENIAMDNAIMQKILPRIQGSSASVKKMLCDMFKFCAGDYEGYNTDDNDISSKMMQVAKKPDCKYKKSARKIAFMVRRYEEDGFTSYWL